MRRSLLAVVALFLLAGLAGARTWTDSTGKHKTEAEVVDCKDGIVQPRKDDGKTVSVPIESLGKTDQEFVRSQVQPSADARGDDPGQTGSPQVIQGGLFQDLDYAFEIRRPSADWEFLREPQAQQRDPEACMGLSNPKTHGFVVIRVERVGEVKLEDYAQLALEGGAFEEGTVLARKDTTLAGKPALELRVQGKIQGLSFSSLVFFVNHEGFAYGLACGSFETDFARNEADLRRIASTLRFLPDRRPQLRSVAVPTKDQHSVDCKITGNRYENASFAFRLTIPPRWRFMGRTELGRLNADACAGLVCVNPELYQIYIVEPMPGVNQDQVRKGLQQNVATNTGVEGPDVVTQVTVADVQATESVYRNVDAEGAKLTMVQTVLFHGDLCFQIHTWGIGEDLVDAEEARKTYEFLSFLAEPERKTLAQELLRSDPDNSVGNTFSLRNGVYRDFQYGFTYQKPPGLWLASTGKAASDQIEDAVLILENPGAGVHVAVIPELLPDVSHRQYHQILLDNMAAPKDTAVQTRTEGDLQFVVSQFDRNVEGLPLTYVLTTAVREERHVQLLVFGLGGNMAQIDQLVPDILGGLEIPAEPPVARFRGRALFQDFRLGYCLATGEPGWQLEIVPLPEAGFEAFGSTAGLSRKNVECVAMGICLPEVDEEMILKGMSAAAGVEGLDPETRKESPDTLAGLPARRISMEGRQLFRRKSLTVWLARHANTTYQFLVSQERGILRAEPDKTAEDYKKFFSLLDAGLVEEAAETEFAHQIAASLDNRGHALGSVGKFSEAIQDLDNAIDIYTRLVEQEARTEFAHELASSLTIRGHTLRAQGKLPEAIADYTAAIRLDPKKAEAYCFRGNAYDKKGDFDRAIADCNEAIRLGPEHPVAYNVRGLACVRKGEHDRAINDFNEAIRLSPTYAAAYFNRALAHVSKGDNDKGIADFDEVIRLDPNNALTYVNRGVAYSNKGEFDKAIADYVEAIRLDPKMPTAHNNLAWLLATCPDAKHRDGRKAVESAAQACELTQRRDPKCLDTLAAAHAEAGDFDAAVKWQTKAIERLPADSDKTDLESRLELYKAGKPYREEQAARRSRFGRPAGRV